jgi:hypothetical protein
METTISVKAHPLNLKFVSITAAVLLLLGIAVWHFDYYSYMVLRLLVCFLSAYCAYICRIHNNKMFWVFIVVAFLFNPIVLLGFLRFAFIALDLTTVILFLVIAKQLRAEFGNEHRRLFKLATVLIAGCVSLTVGVSMVPAFRLIESDADRTMYDRIVEFFATPARLIVDFFIPTENLYLWPWKDLFGTMLLYGFLIWLLLSLWIWIRSSRM